MHTPAHAAGHGGGGQWRIWASAATAVLMIAVVAAAIVGTNRPPQSTLAVAADQASVCSATQVAEQVLPTVVTISATNGRGAGTGSGEVIRSDGHILTNNHVIALAADGGQVSVVFNDGRSVPAVIVGRDPKTDLAVIKVDGQPPLPVIPFGSSDDVVVGQPVVVLGAPLGLSNTVTSGIVSALDRTIEVPGEAGESALLVSSVQTDAAINPGNSGGAMVDCAGQLIGVPSAGATVPDSGGGSIGLGFAIPVDLARAVSEEIIATGKVTHAYFGLSLATVPPAAPGGPPRGAYIRAVVPGAPAAAAGLRAGDIITSADGKPVLSTDDIAALTLTKDPGDRVVIGYARDGKPAETTVTLAPAP
ncbi:putative serine protease PepD [Krasilnikovia cinnamomea]|uniref:Putative serine protease PepD n=2 Tax=Krasilnikovia cinnamomea TaxID=349313 RepID=A0A4Q7ZT80_9ACTN|nr:putative serine protease PepD [Krasilnikovia cinnamomea]